MISILNTIKKLLGPTEVYDHFDTDIIVHINSAFSSLTQLGVGPQDGFFIKDETDLWTDFIQDDKRLEFVKTYIYHDTGESLGGYDVTFGSGDIFTINSANGNYYLILEVDSGATSRGLNAVIQMNGCYLL